MFRAFSDRTGGRGVRSMSTSGVRPEVRLGTGVAVACGLVLAGLATLSLPLHAQSGAHAQAPTASDLPHSGPPQSGSGPGTGGDGLDVTTDTPAYCRSLGVKIDAYPDPPREVRELRSEGEAMCADGHVRGGITRLRRALLAVRAEAR